MQLAATYIRGRAETAWMARAMHGGVSMSGSYDQRTAARKDADLMVTNLMNVSGMLEEVTTVWRRAEFFGQLPGSRSPGNLQAAARNLADTLRALPDADSDEHQALAFSAVTQLSALQNNVALTSAMPGDSHSLDAQLWGAIQGCLNQVGKQLWRLMSHLVKIEEMLPAEDVTARGMHR
jgi:hypothetical protein